MPKLKKLPKPSLSLSEFLANYDYQTLHAATVGLQDSFAWDLLKAYLKVRQREFEIAALDLAGHSNMHSEAAKASGYAQGMEDLPKLVDELREFVLGRSKVVEDPRPEDNN